VHVWAVAFYASCNLRSALRSKPDALRHTRSKNLALATVDAMQNNCVRCEASAAKNWVPTPEKPINAEEAHTGVPEPIFLNTWTMERQRHNLFANGLPLARHSP